MATIPPAWQLARAVAIEAARAGGRAAMRHFGRPGLVVERKHDATPVTVADRESEDACRAVIAAAFPDDGWVGEETGVDRPAAPRRWIVDPVDGTKNFTRGIPLWSTLVACEEDGPAGPRVVAACACFPALDEVYDAVRDGGARCNGASIRVSGIGALAESLFAYYTAMHFDRDALLPVFLELSRATAFQRGGGDAYMHMLVASGRAEFALEPGLALWDVAATSLIVEEAGGRVSAYDGRHDLRAGHALLSNGLVHDAVLAVVARHRGTRREGGTP